MAARGVDLKELVKDLRKQVTALEEDLLARSEEVDEFAATLRSEYQQASEAQHTAAGLFDQRHNPLWELTPSFEATTALLTFWQRSPTGRSSTTSPTTRGTPASSVTYTRI